MTVECAIPVPASVLSRNLVELLRSKAGADVTFIVSGESIVAHKGVLAVRSPVFITEFFGEMKKESRHVEIKGMDARVFNAILGFIYTDAVPELDEGIGRGRRRKRLWHSTCSSLQTEQQNCLRLKAKCIGFIAGAVT
nr:unnamed protein product [Digitaria exilis]